MTAECCSNSASLAGEAPTGRAGAGPDEAQAPAVGSAPEAEVACVEQPFVALQSALHSLWTPLAKSFRRMQLQERYVQERCELMNWIQQRPLDSDRWWRFTPERYITAVDVVERNREIQAKIDAELELEWSYKGGKAD